jgi:zinc protease
MKKLINTSTLILFSLLMISLSLSAQTKEPYEMMVNGVKIIVQPSKNEIVEIQAVFKGGVQNYSANKAGIENLAISALTECGTKKEDKNTFKNKLDKVNALMGGYAGMDYASFSMNCIKSDMGTVWPLYVNALTVPLFDEKEFARIKQDAINNIKNMASQPDYAIEKLARQTAFAGKNYAKEPMGTEAAVKSITATEAKQFFKELATQSKVFFVVVGEIERSELERMFSGLVSKLPAGKPFTYKQEYFSAKANTFKAEKKELATNYLQGVTNGPPPGTKDYNAFVLAMKIFYDRHFLEIRTNNGLSYAPMTYFDGRLSPSANIFVSTTQPNKYVQVFNQLLAKTKQKGFSEEEVKDMKTTYVTSVFYQQETNSDQAYALATNEVLHKNWRRAINLNDELKPLTAKDVSNAFNKYISNICWVYQGNPAQANPQLFTQSSTTKLPPSTFSGKKVN